MGLIPNNACKSKWEKRFSCHASCQEVGKYHTVSQLSSSCDKIHKQGESPGFETQGRHYHSQKQGYQWQNYFFKKKSGSAGKSILCCFQRSTCRNNLASCLIKVSIDMSHFNYSCKTEGGNGISHLIYALWVNCKFTSECYSGIFQNY